MSQELEHKLYHFAATPPERSWETLAEALDQQSHPYVQKLNDFAATPEKHNWDAISRSLSPPEKSAQVLSSPRFRLPVKMMIAAAILAVLAFGIVRIINSAPLTGKSAAGTAKQLHSGVEAKGLQEHVLVKTVDSKNNDQNLRNTSGPEAATQTAKAAKDEKLKASRYVTINTDEGRKVRLSKKAYTLVACAENSTAVNYNRCKETIQMMQQKMSGSLISPSGDFSGLVDMVRSLEDIN